jgi:predicted MPP superfamily phosphohydrolase
MKNPIQIAHISDIHFRGLSRHDEYKRISKILFSQLRDHEVDCIFLGGDIVHSKVQNISPELIEVLSWWFLELAKIAPLHMMLGNHDGLVNNK